MTKQDEKLRLRRRLQDQAVDQAAKNRWEDAVETNLQLINLGEDADTRNRLGKAYFELGKLADARESYQHALRLNSNNAIARKNVETFSRKTKRQWPIEVIMADATSYDFRNEDRVFFMFNPFDAVILGQVVNNIRRSLQSDPRPIWLIYNTPIYHDVIARSGLFIRDEFYEIGCSHFRVYSNQESGGGK